MTNDIQALKKKYLEEYKKSFPRLRELAAAVRKHEVKLTQDSDIDAFWRISGDPKTDYELCQLCSDFSGYDEFFEEEIAPKIQSTEESTPTAIATNPPPDVAQIAKVADEIMMNLYSYECVLNCAWEAIPDSCDHASDARETVRITAKLVAKEAEKLEMKVVWPLQKSTN